MDYTPHSVFISNTSYVFFFTSLGSQKVQGDPKNLQKKNNEIQNLFQVGFVIFF